jgi:hypothetical protein
VRKLKPLPDITTLSDAEVFAEARRMATGDQANFDQVHRELDRAVHLLTATLDICREELGVDHSRVLMALGEVFAEQVVGTEFGNPPVTREQYLETWCRVVKLRVQQKLAARRRDVH